jgi:hypothetical protein
MRLTSTGSTLTPTTRMPRFPSSLNWLLKLRNSETQWGHQ